MPLIPRVARWQKHFEDAGKRHGIDPLLLAAICDRESLGGDALVPPNPAGTGDAGAKCLSCGKYVAGRPRAIRQCACGHVVQMPDVGHGRGLAQLDDRSWADWLSKNNWRDPATNIDKGAEILADNLRSLGGDVEAALAAYNAGPGRVRKALAALPAGATPQLKRAALDALTAGKNYVSDVLRRRDRFAAPR